MSRKLTFRLDHNAATPDSTSSILIPQTHALLKVCISRSTPWLCHRLLIGHHWPCIGRTCPWLENNHPWCLSLALLLLLDWRFWRLFFSHRRRVCRLWLDYCMSYSIRFSIDLLGDWLILNCQLNLMVYENFESAAFGVLKGTKFVFPWVSDALLRQQWGSASSRKNCLVTGDDRTKNTAAICDKYLKITTCLNFWIIQLEVYMGAIFAPCSILLSKNETSRHSFCHLSP